MIKSMLRQRGFFRFSTTNPKDQENFNNVQDWWRVGGSMQPLWQYNYLRVSYIHEILNLKQTLDSLKNLKILDVGVGGGILAESLRRLGAQVVGIDVSQQSIDTAQQHKNSDPLLKNDNQLEYLLSPPEKLTEKYLESFDVITAMEVIEHISEKDMFISALKKLLKPEGYLFISTADKSNESYLKLIVLAEYLTRIVPPGTHQWELFISPLELEKILKKYNMEISNIRGVSYDALRGEMQYSENKTQYILSSKIIK